MCLNSGYEDFGVFYKSYFEEATRKHPRLQAMLLVIIVFISDYQDLKIDHDQDFIKPKNLAEFFLNLKPNKNLFKIQMWT